MTERETIWHRQGKSYPFTVWQGDPDGAAQGWPYRSRWRAILAAWWVSRYSRSEVWIEREPLRLSHGSGA